jgi:hypothetical protein
MTCWPRRRVSPRRAIAETETSFTVRWASRQEMACQFEPSDFEVVEQYSDFDRGPPASDKRQIWVVRRP